MAAYPGAIPTFTGFTSTHTLAADNHAAQHNLEQAEIVQVATKLGTGASTPTAGTLLKGTGAGTSAWQAIDMTTDLTGTLPVNRGGTGVTTEAEQAAIIGALLYPVGAIYTATVSTNPSTLLGFGTWTAFGAGKVPVGLDSGDTDFDTAEETGGAKTVAGASHTHPLSDSGQAKVSIGVTAAPNILIRRITTASWTATHSGDATTTGGSSSAQTVGSGLTGDTDSASPDATSVVQPYIVVYMWKRTA